MHDEFGQTCSPPRIIDYVSMSPLVLTFTMADVLERCFVNRLGDVLDSSILDGDGRLTKVPVYVNTCLKLGCP